MHIGPESCAGRREAVREALTGECAGQPLSHEKADIPGADAVPTKATRRGALSQAPRRPGVVRDPGIGEPSKIRDPLCVRFSSPRLSTSPNIERFRTPPYVIESRKYSATNIGRGKR